MPLGSGSHEATALALKRGVREAPTAVRNAPDTRSPARARQTPIVGAGVDIQIRLLALIGYREFRHRDLKHQDCERKHEDRSGHDEEALNGKSLDVDGQEPGHRGDRNIKKE